LIYSLGRPTSRGSGKTYQPTVSLDVNIGPRSGQRFDGPYLIYADNENDSEIYQLGGLVA